MAATTVASRPKAHNSHPLVNCSDLPELLPGAQSNANPAHREEFEQRCRQLYKDELEHQHQVHQGSAIAHIEAVVGVTSSDMVAMFPNIDPTLVRTLVEEARTPLDAIETLLELSGVVGQRAATPPPLDLGVEDMQTFPSLLDADGWQVVSQHQIERDPDENLGSAWRDRAKAAIPLPAPVAVPSSAWGTAAAAKRRERKEKESDIIENTATQPETDYDLRHRKGQQHARNRAQFSRGSRMASIVANSEHREAAEDGSTSEAFDDEFAA